MISKYSDFIKSETLSDELLESTDKLDDYELNDEMIALKVIKN